MVAAVKGRLGKGDCYPLILEAFTGGVSHETAARVCELLEIPARTKNGISDPVGDLQTFAAKSEPNQLRAAVAIAMMYHEQQFQHWGTAPAAVEWLDWLRTLGYEPPNGTGNTSPARSGDYQTKPTTPGGPSS